MSTSFLAGQLARFDATYRDHPYFDGLKARLLAAFSVLMFAFVPLNLTKLLWVQPPQLGVRVALNLAFALAALLALFWVRRGKLVGAGNGLVLGISIPAHLALFLAPGFAEPLSVGIQLFVFDFIVLLLALVFASRLVIGVVLAGILAGHVTFYLLALHSDPLAGTLRFAADTMMRDGLVAIGFLFCLGVTLVAMIEAAHRRTEEALRETRATNENLGRLVAERTRELEVATLRAHEAAEAKGDFLATMSHEIRTPLNGIIASSELLLERPDLSPESAELTRIIAGSGDLLLKLLGDVLDFSKIEAGQVEMESHPFALVPLVADSVALVAPRAPAGVTVDFEVARGIAANFEGDSFRLRQVLLNLLSNAVKFTAAGGRVRLAVTPGEAASLRFEVRDSGIGMDADTLARVFERFTQADASTARRYGGSGLGLPISFRLVAMMGGRLEAESAPGRGSVFSFAIPLRALPEPSLDVAATAPMAAPLDLHVLVAEDNAVNRKIFATQLAKLGCRCTVVADGEEALAALRRSPAPDVILMDCHMPNLDGWEATRRLRSWADNPDATPAERHAATLPVVALTAATLPEERAKCVEAGMTDFLSKPLKIADLQRCLRASQTGSATGPSVAAGP